MHQALRIDEVLREILNYLDLSSLACLLRTCKSFYPPTLDAFWALQESLTSLIDLLPPDLVRSESVQYLIAIARAKAALDAATIAVANVVEGDIGTMAAANISIIATRKAVGALSAHFTLDEIELLPWYPSYQELPDIRAVGAEIQDDNPNAVGSTRLPPPIKIITRNPTEEEVALVLRRSAHIKRILYTTGEEKALLVFDAIIKQHPELVFFSELKEIIIVVSPIDSWKWAGWLSTPFILLPKASKVVVRGISTHAPVPGRGPGDVGLPGHVHVDLGSILTGVAAYTGSNRLHELVLDSNELTLVDDEDDLRDGHDGFLQVLEAHKSSLRSISLSIMPGTRVWSVLAELPNLEELRIGGAKYDRVRVHTYPAHPELFLRTFASLRSLHLSYYGISSFTFSCLNLSTFPVLDTIHITPTVPLHITWAISSVAAGTPNLRRLIFDTSLCDDTSHVVLDGTDLAPLVHSCHRLEHLEVPSQGSHYCFELDNATVEAMAIAWPSLTFLSLAADSSPKSAVTLEGLLPFAKHCPNLTTLHLAVDETAVLYVYASAIYRVELDGPRNNHSEGGNGAGSGSGQRLPSMLQELNIGAPWVHDTAACAEFFRCIFPNLERLVAPDRYDHSSGRMYAWNKVVKLVHGNEMPASVEQASQLQGQLDKMAIDEDYYYEGSDSASSGDDVDDQSEDYDWDEERLKKALIDIGVTDSE